MVELIILAAFSVALLICVALGVPLFAALLLGYCLFFSYGLKKGFTAGAVLKMSAAGVKTVKNILVTFLLIGVITAVWRVSGTIPFIVYFASGVFSPPVMPLMTFLLCCLMSLLTGTAFGTAATVGVICMTMARSMGVPDIITGGAVLAGSFFGDRCSPMSTSALLIASLTDTDIYDNIKTMLKTALFPFAASVIVYLAAGLLTGAEPSDAAVREVFAHSFVLSPFTLLPAVIVIVLSLLRVKVKAAMAASIAAGIAVALAVQRTGVTELLKTAVLGFEPENGELAALLSGGGVASMLNVILIVCLSSCCAGIFGGTGFLDGIKSRIAGLGERRGHFTAVLLTAFASALIACNQTLNIMLTHQLCGDIESDRSKLASYLENTAVVISPLIPWSIASAVPLESVGAPTASIAAACYLYLIPLWMLIAETRGARRGAEERSAK